MTLSERIREAMREAGVSQVALAKACGVKPPSVNGWLSGKSKFLRGENLLKAASALKVSEEWLAEGRGPMKKQESKVSSMVLPNKRVRSNWLSDDEYEIISRYRGGTVEGRQSLRNLAEIIPQAIFDDLTNYKA